MLAREFGRKAKFEEFKNSCCIVCILEHQHLSLFISQSAEQISALCRNFQEVQTSSMEGQKDNQDLPPRPLARHLSDADRLRKVIQELMDTEKSYVKVIKSG